MIPNWLLGKSKSKLQEILGGGGGGGATYTAGEGIDITNHEISVDPLLMNDIEQTALAIPTKAAKTQISNPNILHNPWFSVNQRGFTTNTGSTKWWPADRWYVIGDNKTVTRASDGILTIKNEANTNIFLVQKGAPNKMASLIGKKVTASIMFSDGTIKSGTITFNANERQTYLMENNFELYKNNSSDGNTLLAFTMPAGELAIKALKLEVGEISTLHLDPRPEYALELAKCQRYFQRISGEADSVIDWGVTAAGTSGPIRYCIHIKEMIAKPAISYSNVRCGSSTPTSFTLKGYTTGRVQVDATISAALTPDIPYRLLIASGGYIDFDAEL